MLLLTEPAEPAEGERTDPRRSFLLERPEGRARGSTHGGPNRLRSLYYIICII